MESIEQILPTVDEFEAARLIDDENICSATAGPKCVAAENATGQNIRQKLPEKEREIE